MDADREALLQNVLAHQGGMPSKIATIVRRLPSNTRPKLLSPLCLLWPRSSADRSPVRMAAAASSLPSSGPQVCMHLALAQALQCKPLTWALLARRCCSRSPSGRFSCHATLLGDTRCVHVATTGFRRTVAHYSPKLHTGSDVYDKAVHDRLTSAGASQPLPLFFHP